MESVVSGNSTTVVFLEGPVTLSNVYEKVKIFEIIESRKPRGIVENPFGLERFSLVISSLNQALSNFLYLI